MLTQSNLRAVLARLSEHNTLIILAVVLGLVTGLAIWLFREAIDLARVVFAEWLAASVLSPLVGAAAVIISLALAGALVGAIMERFIGEERHHGVAGIIEAVALTGGRLRYERMPFKAMASALSLGAGASVGPEDPSVQIGSNIGSWFGQALRLSEDQVRMLVAAGAASAIAAAFKAPIAGVFFALEVVLNGAFEARSFGIVVLAAVVASALTQAIEPGAEMGPFNYTLGSVLEIPFFVPLGLLMGGVSALFIRAMYWQQAVWHDHIKLPRPAKTALAGALVGMVGIFLPQIMGTGRETMSAILSGEAQFTLTLLLALGAFKLVMTAVSMAGGFVGGIFAPTLLVGVTFGSAYGRIITTFLPRWLVGDSQTYAIAGMAAVMAGVVRSPITAIMLVFELTNDYRLILPIMLATVVCIIVAERFEPFGMYILGLRRKGIFLTMGREIDLMQSVRVDEAMRTPAPTIPEGASLQTLRDSLRASAAPSLCVVDSAGLLCGIVTLSDLQRAYQPDAERALTVGEICSREVVTICPDDSLWTAIRVMNARDVGRLPVVERGTRKLVGLIGRHGMMRAYNIAMSRKLQDQHTAERLRLQVLTGAHVVEFYMHQGSPLVGKHIADIAWPPESVIASIQRRGQLIIPHGDTDIQADDLLVIVAAPAAEAALHQLLGAEIPV